MIQRESLYRLLGALTAGFILLFVPLVRNFHIESAIIASLAGTWGVVHVMFQNKKATSAAGDFKICMQLLVYIYAMGLPLFIRSLIIGCLTLDGIAFWILFPVPSVFFSAGIARIVRNFRARYYRSITFFILIMIAGGGWLIEFYSLPQVYFHNHIWGGWPGPIYDEAVHFTTANLLYRLMTIMWSVVLWTIPMAGAGRFMWGLPVAGVCFLIFSYTQLAKWGIISPESYLQKQLTGVEQTPHFTIYYDARGYSKSDIKKQALLHEFYLEQITRRLDVDFDYENNKINSYLYRHPWQKKKFTGAKYTSYVPVWLEQDQLHIAKFQLESSLKHELVHIVAKQFGNRLINASWNIGLVEGLAVAVAGRSDLKTGIDQLTASTIQNFSNGQLMEALSFSGFYTGRSSVNYTVMGSFIRYLLATYPVSSFKEAYKTGSLVSAYAVSVDSLLQQWRRSLEKVDYDSLDQQQALALFSRPSIFEKNCPHKVTPVYHAWDRYKYFKAEKKEQKAFEYIQKAKNSTKNNEIWNHWARQALRQGKPHRIIRADIPREAAKSLIPLKADAFFINGKAAQARELLETQSIPRADSLLRQDSTTWRLFVEMEYQEKLPREGAFSGLNNYSKLAVLQAAIELQEWEKVVVYASVLLHEEVTAKAAPVIISMIEWLIVHNHQELAQKWLIRMNQLDLQGIVRPKLDELQSLMNDMKINNLRNAGS